MSLSIRVVAYSVPAICIVLGFIMVFFGQTTNNPSMTSSGWLFFVVGALLQVLWLYRRAKW